MPLYTRDLFLAKAPFLLKRPVVLMTDKLYKGREGGSMALMSLFDKIICHTFQLDGTF